MKKFVIAIAILFATAFLSPASAAPWTSAVQAAIAKNNYAQINIIVASNPSAAGDIAAYLLQQAQNDAASNPGKAIKLFDVATPLTGQVSPAEAPNVVTSLTALLALANDPAFQKKDPHGAAEIFANVLNVSAEANIAGQSPHLHDIALSEANDFLHNNPDLNDKKLAEDIELAQGNDFLHNNPDTDVKKLKEQPGDLPPPGGPSGPPPSAE
jgi:hypothetical protein